MQFLRSLVTASSIVLTTVIAACGKNEMPAPETPRTQIHEPTPSSSPASAVVVPLTTVQDWNGLWFGPEGTSLTLAAKENSKYLVTLESMDGVIKKFEGVAGPDYIQFDREGVQERIKATDGEGTGMKWLADESNCLTIKEGEGYCRK